MESLYTIVSILEAHGIENDGFQTGCAFHNKTYDST